MKKLSISLLTIILSFCLMSTVNAAEQSLDTVASLTNVIGGSEQEIVQTGTGTYTYYYKTIAIDDSDFSSYVSSKYIVDNGDDSSDEYVTAQSRVSEYETTFEGLIATLNSTSDLNSWTKSTNNEIALSNLTYETGTHHGYVLAVAAVKDSTIYATRVILETKSATTLGALEYNDTDKSNYESSTSDVTTTEETSTTENPETGIEDWTIYLVPISIVLGSGIILRRNYA